jgi:hypothetical protein
VVKSGEGSETDHKTKEIIMDKDMGSRPNSWKNSIISTLFNGHPFRQIMLKSLIFSTFSSYFELTTGSTLSGASLSSNVLLELFWGDLNFVPRR